MATFSAIKTLGRAIKSDLGSAVTGVSEKVADKRAERKAVKLFREILREDPKSCAKAFAALNPKPKARKPRATTKKGA